MSDKTHGKSGPDRSSGPDPFSGPDPLTGDLRFDDYWGPAEPTGIRSSSLGAFVPEGTYRPLPIVWLVSAWLLHSFAMMILLALLSGKPVLVTLGVTLIASYGVGSMLFERGMKDAALGWKISTVLALAVNWALTAVSALGIAGY